MSKNSKVNIDKIKGLAKSKGITIKHLCDAFGLGRGYLNDVKAGKTVMDAARVATIAGMLNTTVEYLMDETDDPEIKKDSVDNWNGVRMNAERKKIMDVIASLSDEEVAKVEKILEAVLGAEK